MMINNIYKITSKEQFYKFFGNKKYEYKIIKDFNNDESFMTVRHFCGHEYELYPEELINHKCKCCSQSKGAMLIENYLTQNNIKFSTEKTFEELKSKYKLRFDFALYNNDELVCMLEYDGQYHDKEDDTNYEYNKLRDEMKDDFCKENSIPLYRISYKDLNILNEILVQILISQKLKPAYSNKNNITMQEVKINMDKEIDGIAYIFQKLEGMLIDNGIFFKKNIRFKECRNKCPLVFNYGVYSSEGKLLFLIDLKSERHFKIIDDTPEMLERNIQHDYIKKEFCSKNKIDLYEIQYFKFDDIEFIVSDILYKNNLIDMNNLVL